MKTKVAFIIALMVTLFAAVVYVGARPSESVATNETANVVAVSEEVQTNTNNAVSQTQANPKKGLEIVAADSADIVNLKEVGVYIVQLQDPPLALYAGGIEGLSATNAETNGQQKLDATSSASVAYMDYLLVQQDIALADISSLLGRDVKAQYQYKATLNGFAVELSGAEAADVASLSEVRHIERERISQPMTDAGPAWMGADDIWSGDATGGAGTGTMGEGILVGVIDTGVDPWNPSFADIGGDGYDHPTHPAVTANGGNFFGVCDPTNTSPPAGVAAYDPTFVCNDKLIGAWGYTASDPSPRDGSGHGSHTASTAAGNFVFGATITGTDVFTANISGVAPHAHIIMYDGCSDTAPGCPGSSLSAARDQALLDGVDVINYSIGGGTTPDPWTDAESLQWLALRAAGVFVATSAGNAGPGDETLGSPGDIPWITSVGASSSNRMFRTTLVMTNANPLSPTIAIDGLSLTGPLTETSAIVFAVDYGDALCAPGAFAPGTFNGEIVVCERGTHGRVEKGQSVLDGGAGGYILAQPTELGGGPGAALAAVHVLPASHIDYYEYQELLTAHASGYISGTISGAVTDTDPANGDMMASFSSRGPNSELSDLIVPSVTAPGHAIWAAYHQGSGGDGDYTYNVIQGTSMSSPHVAGAYALLKATHPEWTPTEAQSALMSTANANVTNDDGVNVATPFAQGSGSVDVAAATQAGFVMNITESEYEDANPVSGGQVRDLNTASLGNANCVGVCTWTRTFDSVATVPVTWTSTVTGVTGLLLSVTPATFNLAPGATQVVTFEADISAIPITTTWQFGSVSFTPDVTNTVEAHLPVAVVPSTGSLPSIIEISTRRAAGSKWAFDLETIEIPTMTLRTFGLVLPITHTFTLTQADLAPDFPDIFFQPATEFTEVTVPVGSMRFLAEIMDTTSPDLDMIVFHDANDNGVPELDDVDMDNPNATCQSASGGSYEKCDIMNPVDGRWFVAVFNYETSATPPDPVELHTAVVSSDAGNMTVDAPASVAAGTLFDVQVYYNEPAMMAGEVWYGAFDMGTDAANPGNVGAVPVDVVRYADDVTKTVDRTSAPVNGLVQYTIEIQPNITGMDMVHTITDTIPAGMTYISGTVTGGAVVTGNTLTWSDTMVGTYSYNMTTSDNDAMCDTPFGGYVNLEAFGILTQPSIFGDTEAWTAFSTGLPFSYYGSDYAGMSFTDDGFAIFDPDQNYGGSPWTPQTLPDSADPNNLIAALWQDMEIFYDGPTNTGVSLASAGPNIAIVEYDNIEFWGGSADNWDFEIVALRQPVDAPGNYEYVIAYDNLNGDLTGPLTVGVENAAGDDALPFVNNADASAALSDGFMVCYDWAGPTSAHVITYWAKVDTGVASGTILTNTVTHDVENDGSIAVDVDVAVEVVDVAYGVDLSGDDAGQAVPGGTVSYMVTITNTGNVTDTYDIVTIGTWDAPIAPITLLWGETATFMVDVNIPASAPNGSYATSTVTATSQGDGMMWDMTTLTTTVDVFYVFMPVVIK